MDELLELMAKLKTTGVGANHVKNGKNRAADPEPNLCRAIKATVLLLSDHQWHRLMQVKTIANLNSVDLDKLSAECEIAQSDSGHWVCLPGDKTPEKAPDEQ